CGSKKGASPTGLGAQFGGMESGTREFATSAGSSYTKMCQSVGMIIQSRARSPWGPRPSVGWHGGLVLPRQPLGDDQIGFRSREVAFSSGKTVELGELRIRERNDHWPTTTLRRWKGLAT